MVLAVGLFAACDDGAADNSQDQGQGLGKADSADALTVIKNEGFVDLNYTYQGWIQDSKNLYQGRQIRMNYGRSRALHVLEGTGCDEITEYRSGDDYILLDFFSKYTLSSTLFVEFRAEGRLLDTRSFSSIDSVMDKVYIPEGTTDVVAYALLKLSPVDSDAPTTICEAWDNNFGSNFSFPVKKAAAVKGTLAFRGEWKEEVDGTVTAGKSVRIAYDSQRMMETLNSSWTSYKGAVIPPSIIAHIRVDNGSFIAVSVGHYEATMENEKQWVDDDPVVYIPTYADFIEIYFEVRGYMGTTGYDSNGGANYFFDVKK